MFAPVDRLGLVAIWDDGDDLHAEPRAPYPHAREVLLTRAQLAGAAALVGGFARTAEAQLLVETGWAREIVADRATRAGADARRSRRPATTRSWPATRARPPPGCPAWPGRPPGTRCAAGAPVLVQVPRRGYLPVGRLRRTAAPRPAARTAPGRWRCRRPRGVAGLPLVRPGRRRVRLPGVRRPAAAGRR